MHVHAQRVLALIRKNYSHRKQEQKSFNVSCRHTIHQQQYVQRQACVKINDPQVYVFELLSNHAIAAATMQ